MNPENLKKLLTTRKAQADQEKLAHLERLGIAEGVALACQATLDALDAPDPEEPT